MKNKSFFTFAFCLVFVFTFHAQSLKEDAVVVSKSNVIEEMEKQKKRKPQISAKELADFGNNILSEKGYEFTFAAEQSSILISNVDVDSDAFEIYKLKQISGRTQLFATREHGSHPCGTWTGLTVAKLSEKQMTVLANGKRYPVTMPKELTFDDVELVEKNLKRTIRRWLTPLDATPEAISKDGKTIYISIEIGRVFLGISDAGDLSFVSADDKNIVKNSVEVRNFPKDPKNDYLGYKKFSDGKQNYFLRFSNPCT